MLHFTGRFGIGNERVCYFNGFNSQFARGLSEGKQYCDTSITLLYSEEEFGKDIGKELTDKEFYQKIREGKMPPQVRPIPNIL